MEEFLIFFDVVGDIWVVNLSGEGDNFIVRCLFIFCISLLKFMCMIFDLGGDSLGLFFYSVGRLVVVYGKLYM